MTDRELLEAAAKAAGHGVEFACTQWEKFWADDKQIVSLTVQRFYGAAPRVDVRVAAV